jgi:hypothetical protein
VTIGNQTITIEATDTYSFTQTAMSLVMEDYLEWEQALKRVATVGRGANWWLGDAMVYGEFQFGEAAAQAFPTKQEGYEPGTLRNMRYVSRQVAPERRRDELPWSFHSAVAPLEPGDQVEVLQRCIDGDWTREELRAVVKSILAGEEIPGEPGDQQAKADPLIHIRTVVTTLRGDLESALATGYPDEMRERVELALTRLDGLADYLGMTDD